MRSQLDSPPGNAADNDADPAPMYCRQCDYLLIGLSEYRCPECGTRFHPNNMTTFFTLPRKQRNILAAQKRAKKFATNLIRAFLPMIVCGAVAMWIAVSFQLEEYTQYVCGLWLFHVFIAMPLSWPVLSIGHDRRVVWKPWELIAFIVPFSILARCIALSPSSHGYGEILAAVALSITIPIAAWVRMQIGNRMNQIAVSIFLLLCLCGISVAAYGLFSRII